MTKDNPLTVVLRHDKETKRMHRYTIDAPEDEWASVLGSLYIAKATLKGQQVPATLTVTIQP